MPVSRCIRRAVSSCAGRRVDADDARTSAREPRKRKLRGAEAELDHVEAH
jgi:hypothetical protein